MRLNYYDVNPEAFDRLSEISENFDSIDKKLLALVQLRVSQLNRCAYCISIKSDEVSTEGETQERVDHLPTWYESTLFNEGEKAALAWAESLTLVAGEIASEQLYRALQQHFSDRQVVDLTLAISLMNAWNRIAYGFGREPDCPLPDRRSSNQFKSQ